MRCENIASEFENPTPPRLRGAKGGDYMIKKISIATGVFVASALTVASMAFAQTTTVAPSGTMTVTPTTTVPAKAPATGRAS